MKYRIPSLLALFLTLSTPALADETETIFVRAKFGNSYFSSLDPVSSALGVGLDLGFRTAGGFGLTGMAKLGFDGSKYDGTGDLTVQTRFFGIAPTYSVTKGAAILTFGIGVGTYALTSQYRVGYNASPTKVSTSRLGIAPLVQADFALSSSISLGVGTSYLVSLGKKPNFSEFLPMAGIGFLF